MKKPVKNTPQALLNSFKNRQLILGRVTISHCDWICCDLVNDYSEGAIGNLSSLTPLT